MEFRFNFRDVFTRIIGYMLRKFFPVEVIIHIKIVETKICP